MRGEGDRGLGVRVLIDDARLRLVAGNELIGEWERSELGISALHEGFLIRADGEEIVLVTDDDPAVAEALGIAAATPRLARRLAASHPPVPHEEESPAPEAPSRLAPIALAIGGAMVLAGGFVFSPQATSQFAGDEQAPVDGAGRFWLAFVIGGLLVAGLAYVLATGRLWARVAAVLVLLGIVVLFAISVQGDSLGPADILGYGFIAGGLVVGVAVVFSGSLSRGD
jgi:hypothetical protein